MKTLFLAAALCCGIPFAASTGPEVMNFPLQDVRLLDSPFKQAQELDKAYILALDPDRLLAPYLREAGLPPKSVSYTNWENTGLDGHIGGHYLTALSLMYAATGEEELMRRLEYMISELKRCQDHLGTGYIGGVPGSSELWESVAKAVNEVGGFSLGNKWVPLYNIHKMYAGLRDAYLIAGIREAKEMVVRMTDWMEELLAGLTDEQMQNVLRSEHGGLNEVFADVAALTGDEKYLKLAHRFSHLEILNPLLEQRDDLTGKHANTQIPKVIGFKRIADLEEDNRWDGAARFFWNTVVENRSVSIGGNSAYEHFHPLDDFSRMIYSEQGPETCNTYNMLKLTAQLYATDPDPRYMDYYERAVYNHILSTGNPRVPGFVYFTPMRPGHYRVYSQPETSFWCCVGSGLENHAKYGEMIYHHAGDDLYVNLFIPSVLNWSAKGVELVQENAFPEEERTAFTINSGRPETFTLKLRYPGWVAPGEAKVWVNGEPWEITTGPGAYITLDRTWQKGDRVEYLLPMRTTVEQLPDHSAFFSILHGPVVLAAKTTEEEQPGLFADDSRGGHIAHGRKIPLNELPFLVAEPADIPSLVKPVAGKPLTFTLDHIYPDRFSGIELIPFYRLHESRYILYWQQTTPDGLEALVNRLTASEKERAALDAITVDQVTCGEQQPESDHFFAGERTGTGLLKDLHYRHAHGWFGYELRNPEGRARKLQVTYCGTDKDRGTELLIGEVKIAEITPEGTAEELSTIEVALPVALQKEQALSLRFRAVPGRATARITAVRLLSE